jgi:hypothetical protein
MSIHEAWEGAVSIPFLYKAIIVRNMSSLIMVSHDNQRCLVVRRHTESVSSYWDLLCSSCVDLSIVWRYLLLLLYRFFTVALPLLAYCCFTVLTLLPER